MTSVEALNHELLHFCQLEEYIILVSTGKYCVQPDTISS